MSGANKDNFELIYEEFEDAKIKYLSIQDKEVKRFYTFLEKNQLDLPKLLSKKDFLKK